MDRSIKYFRAFDEGEFTFDSLTINVLKRFALSKCEQAVCEHEKGYLYEGDVIKTNTGRIFEIATFDFQFVGIEYVDNDFYIREVIEVWSLAAIRKTFIVSLVGNIHEGKYNKI